uniref:NADH dehydrogenase [ubiquinone] 1 subunit C2 n=1 Tax=Felis catus TaxID=9685 RepID=A0ABI7WQY8_FELCA
MMSRRPGKSLPQPRLTDLWLVHSCFLGDYFGLIDNAIWQRLVVSASLHCQLLYVTSFVFIGYDLLKHQEYIYAVKDHGMFTYVKSHPEDFPEKDKKTYGEFLEEFHQVFFML